jgi:hypothetical protein
LFEPDVLDHSPGSAQPAWNQGYNSTDASVKCGYVLEEMRRSNSPHA